METLLQTKNGCGVIHNHFLIRNYIYFNFDQDHL